MKVLEEVESSINGKLTVVKDLAWGVHVIANGLTQSGGIAKQIWVKPFRKVARDGLRVENCLILGLGAGGIVPLIKKRWPGAKITGVEIDSVMVELGRKYFDLSDVEIEIEDAYKFVRRTTRNPQQYNLILIDTYLGDKYPKHLESKNYLHSVRSVLARRGIVVFNRLYYDDKRSQAMKFLKKLEKIFPKVEAVYPVANVMFICSSL